MQNKSLNSFTKLIVLFIIFLVILLSKSIEANIILIILTLILILLINISILEIFKILNKNKILLIISLFLSLIFMNVFILFKTIIFILLVNIYIITNKKIELFDNFLRIFKPLELFNINTKHMAIKTINYFTLFNSEKENNYKALVSQNRLFLNISFISIIVKIRRRLNNLCNRLSQYENKKFKFGCYDLMCIIFSVIYLGITFYVEVIL